jgi:uncharacterized membrane protein
MNRQSPEQFRNLLMERMETFTRFERTVIQHILERKQVTRNTNKEFEEQLTFGQRVADRVASFGGSWTFIIIFAGVIIGWIILNAVILAKGRSAFDPYPFILLNLVLSMTAAIQAPVIMMAQNRQSAKDRLDAAHDFEVNLKAEMEIAALHEKLDQLREKQWSELVEMQQEQIRMLTKLLEEKNNG